MLEAFSKMSQWLPSREQYIAYLQESTPQSRYLLQVVLKDLNFLPSSLPSSWGQTNILYGKVHPAPKAPDTVLPVYHTFLNLSRVLFPTAARDFYTGKSQPFPQKP